MSITQIFNLTQEHLFDFHFLRHRVNMFYSCVYQIWSKMVLRCLVHMASFPVHMEVHLLALLLFSCICLPRIWTFKNHHTCTAMSLSSGIIPICPIVLNNCIVTVLSCIPCNNWRFGSYRLIIWCITLLIFTKINIPPY